MHETAQRSAASAAARTAARRASPRLAAVSLLAVLAAASALAALLASRSVGDAASASSGAFPPSHAASAGAAADGPSSAARAAQPPRPAYASACAAGNPYFITPCYALGNRGDEPAIVAFRDDPNNGDHHMLADYGQVGATYGIAVDSEAGLVYAAAYHKRAAPYGPGGPGMIYRLDLETGAVEEWLDVPDAAPAQALHDPEGNFVPDRVATRWVGKASLGDIDLTPDGAELFVMNLYSREILRYSTADGSLIGRFDHGAALFSWAAREARPFGLKVHEGKLYHAVVRDASRSRSRQDLDGYVYESDLDGGSMRPVLAFGLDYLRGTIQPNIPAHFLPWRDSTSSIAPDGTHDHAYIYPMPMISDIEFADDGRMILGIRDRIGDMSLYDRNRRLPTGERSGHPFGDILLAERDGENWRVDPWPEFFAMDAGGGLHSRGGFHIDTGFGGLARIPAPEIVVNTAVSPEQYHSGGAIWFDLSTGEDTARETLYVAPAGEPDFGKANGLGDLELVCPAELPTATPTATATATPVATATPTPSPTASATPTATEAPRWTIYLPYAENLCVPEKRHIDVVLVLDRSTSMLRTVEEGGAQKNEAAIAAARSFVDLLQLEPDAQGRHDQVAVVGFNDLAWTETMLTNDRARANAALDTLGTKTQEGTRLDLALQQGQQPLDGPERILANEAVLILLTDGLPNRVPFPPGGSQHETVLQVAQDVKDRGTKLFTIGLGTPTDIFPQLMILAASEPYNYRYAPRPEDLEAIYRWILDRFTYCGRKNAPPEVPCIPERNHADVAIVLDMSTSMYRPTRAGRTKHEAAVAAAHEFIDELKLEQDGWGRRDRVAVAGFQDEAWTQIDLTSDRAAAHAAVDGLLERIHEGTRLDLAFEEGRAMLERQAPLPGNRRVLVVLTDGLPNRVPFPPGGSQEQTVLEAAQRAKDAGARVFTVGLGLPDDVLRELLQEAASAPRDYFFAPDGEDLSAIYRQIAGRIVECD